MRTRFFIPTVAALALAFVATTLGFSEEPEKRERPAPSESEMTYLGVSTFHLAPPLRNHLEISEGFGIQVLEVLPGSPAAKAGMKKNDILLRFNDQLLISPEHLSLLVKREEPSSEVTLGLIRKGGEEELQVKLGTIDRQSQRIRPRPENPRLSPEQWQEHLKNQQDYWQRWMDRRQPDQKSDAPGPKSSGDEPKVSGRPPPFR